MLIILYLLNKERSKALSEFHKVELNGAPVDAWLIKALHGGLVVSVEDLKKQ
jgi:hypothetical protein